MRAIGRGLGTALLLALVSGCARLCSEDMQHGWGVDGLEVVNPFA